MLPTSALTEGCQGAWKTQRSILGSLCPVPRRSGVTGAPKGHPGPALVRAGRVRPAPLGLAVSRGRRSCVPVQAFINNGFPFREVDYYKADLVKREPYGPLKLVPPAHTGNVCSGVLVFQQANVQQFTTDTEVLEVFVAGDTCGNISSFLNNQPTDRPMAHELMYQVMEQAARANRGHMTLLKVAIVALKDDVFVGRMFFGDPLTRRVAWDTDCRPSDACYLHLRSHCPFYIAREVWRHAAVPVRHSKVHLLALADMEAKAAAAQLSQMPVSEQEASNSSNATGSQPPSSSAQDAHTKQGSGGGGSNGNGSGTQADEGKPDGPVTPEEVMEMRADDPEPIKLLKRKLQVAVSEEDYRAAVKIRDHPYLQLYRQVHESRYFGREAEAVHLEGRLKSLMNKSGLGQH